MYTDIYIYMQGIGFAGFRITAHYIMVDGFWFRG
jgi:hypothetical protein